MRLPRFDYLEPKSLKEAIKFLTLDKKGSVILGGGTDLLVNMKHRVIQPKCLINLKKIPRLAYIAKEKHLLKVGALTSLHDLASSSILQEQYPALCKTAKEVGAYAHQTMGTLGGNLCQENRCRFYNQSASWRKVRPPCYKGGGKMCYVVRKPGQCHSAYCGDMAPVLIAMDSQIKTVGPNGERTFPLKKLYTQNGKKPLSLKKGEIVKEVLIPALPGKTLYLKWRLRDSLEFPILSLALYIEKDRNQTIKKGRILFGAVGPGPIETLGAEKMLKGALLDEQMIEKISIQAAKEISPMRTSIHSPAYKRKMAGILLRQVLEEILK